MEPRALAEEVASFWFAWDLPTFGTEFCIPENLPVPSKLSLGSSVGSSHGRLLLIFHASSQMSCQIMHNLNLFMGMYQTDPN